MSRPSEAASPRSSVIVTGAARGIGAAIAARFADDGYAVVGLDLDGDGLTATIAALPGEGHSAVIGDAGSEETLADACDAAEASGPLWGFVANAGVAQPGDSFDYPMQAWDRLMAIHLRAPFLGARATAARMSGGGSIVMISSVNAHLGFGGRAAYSAAKTGVQGLVRSLAVEWAPRGIRVNAVSPGSIATPMHTSFKETGFANEAAWLSRIPMGRLGRPDEIADAVAYLTSRRSSYITGTVLPVDGGWIAFGLPSD